MGRTVTTYLIDGDPKGTQYVFVSNMTFLCIDNNRNNNCIFANEYDERRTYTETIRDRMGRF